ncbi:MurR/RpiR family transcriptional regulator [Salipiger abyssi]|uniref:MurR/RpiR family transcriptional regulator n=1 Tax=Salipiger abyssi TaxID=1250539 RepID=UPI001A908322|nr:MurR/RpiR family transcriptional regulator [Salipiger abyssi]MBN9888958.1 MurR/RpiR family transcriptional regulator [Salipiger abyssi]
MFLTYQADMGHLRKEALIRLADVSRSTADRLVRRLGYRNYRELQQSVRNDFSWGAPQVPEGAVAPNWSDVIEADRFNITETFSTIDPAEIEALCERVASAPKVWVMGLRASVGLAEIATHYLGQVRRGVHGISGDSATWSRDLALLDPGDVLLIFAFRRRPTVLPRLITEARRLGATTVLITDISAGASARVADHALRCSGQSPSPLISFSAAITIVNVLTLGVAQRLGEASRKHMDDVNKLVRSVEAVSSPYQRPRDGTAD